MTKRVPGATQGPQAQGNGRYGHHEATPHSNSRNSSQVAARSAACPCSRALVVRPRRDARGGVGWLGCWLCRLVAARNWPVLPAAGRGSALCDGQSTRLMSRAGAACHPTVPMRASHPRMTAEHSQRDDAPLEVCQLLEGPHADVKVVHVSCEAEHTGSVGEHAGACRHQPQRRAGARRCTLWLDVLQAGSKRSPQHHRLLE